MRSCPDLLDQGWPRDQLRRPARDRRHRGHASGRPAVRRGDPAAGLRLTPR